MSTMLAAELYEIDKPLRLVRRPIPEPGPGQVRVRVEACGVCGSDLFLQKGGHNSALPLIPGHEAAGVVDALGPGVDVVNVGDQVALYYIDSPVDSPYARKGRSNIGPEVRRMGVDVDGGFAEYVVRPVHTLVVPPRRVEPATLAVLTDAVATPYHSLVKMARLQPGETLAVLGIGGIGSNAVQLGKWLGARVVAVSRSEASLDLARELGADEAVRSDDGALELIRAACGGDGPDVVIQCVGSARLDELAIALVAPGGRVVLVGAAVEPFSVRAIDLIWRELTILGNRGFTEADIAEVINLYLGGEIVTDHLTTNIRPLTEVNEALDDLRAGRGVRSVLVP
jgi:alcohol dehydrogenase, propanol-preferring